MHASSRLGDTGLEPATDSKRKTANSGERAAKCAALTVGDPGLRSVVEAWPGLPEPIKTAIRAMVRSQTG
jgi:hypothetical protein